MDAVSFIVGMGTMLGLIALFIFLVIKLIKKFEENEDEWTTDL